MRARQAAIGVVALLFAAVFFVDTPSSAEAFVKRAGPSDEELVKAALRFLARPAEADDKKSRGLMAGSRARSDAASFVRRFVEACAKGQDPKRRSDGKVDGVSDSFYANWMLGYDILAIAEETARGASVPRRLRSMLNALAQRQNAEGGFGHGEMSVGGFYPSTLMATTHFALLAIGVGERAGISADRIMLDDALALARDVQTPSGAMPYGGRAYRVGPEAGRTAGFVLAYAALGKTDDPVFLRARDYVLSHMESIPDGHASPSMHIYIGACAAWILGDDAWNSFDRSVLTRVRAAARADGGFDDFVADSPDSLEIMDRKSVRDDYVTACYAAALSVPRSRFLATLRREIAARPMAKASIVADESEGIPRLVEKSAVDCGAQVRALCTSEGRVAALTADGRVLLVSRNGDETTAAELPGGRVVAEGGMIAAPGGFIVVDSEGSSDVMTIGGRTAEEGSEEPRHRTRCSYVRIEPLSVAWSVPIAGDLPLVRVAGGIVHLVTRSGSARRLSLADGSEVGRPSTSMGSLGAALAVSENFTIVACQNRARAFAIDGEERWQIANRPTTRGLVPPMWTGVQIDRETLYGVHSDGNVVAIDISSGARRWEATTSLVPAGLTMSTSNIVPIGDEDLWVGGADGRICRIVEGRITVQRNLGGGRESHAPARLVGDDEALWLAVPSRESLFRLDPKSGECRETLRLPRGAPWTVAGEQVHVAVGSIVRAY